MSEPVPVAASQPLKTPFFAHRSVPAAIVEAGPGMPKSVLAKREALLRAERESKAGEAAEAGVKRKG